MEIKIELSVSSVKTAIKEIKNYQKELIEKCKVFAERLADEGIFIAQSKIAEYGAIDSNALSASITKENSEGITQGAIWKVYTACEWAPFIEFGFGVVGENNPHPDTSLIGWKYDINDHGEKGWYYQKDGEWYWSNGQIAKPFLYETGRDLREVVTEIAKEVFDN